MPSAASSDYLSCMVKRNYPKSVFWSLDIVPHKFTDGNIALIFMSTIEYKGKGKGHPITGHEGPRRGVEV
jgi:hypothetical protein